MPQRALGLQPRLFCPPWKQPFWDLLPLALSLVLLLDHPSCSPVHTGAPRGVPYLKPSSDFPPPYDPSLPHAPLIVQGSCGSGQASSLTAPHGWATPMTEGLLPTALLSQDCSEHEPVDMRRLSAKHGRLPLGGRSCSCYYFLHIHALSSCSVSLPRTFLQPVSKLPAQAQPESHLAHEPLTHPSLHPLVSCPSL